jgi:predicted nucleic-acid-binding Zn-ribbon protein
VAGATEITCPQCQNKAFLQGKAQLNTAAMSLLDLDWANKSATTLICAQCSHISWFHDEPQRTEGVY